MSGKIRRARAPGLALTIASAPACREGGVNKSLVNL